MTTGAADEKVYYAHRRPRPDGRVVYLHASVSRPWLDLHGVPDPVVRVTVRAWKEGDAPSTYWGWLRAGEDRYTLVWPSANALDICFPCGADVAESLGQGRKVHLVVQEKETAT